MRVPLSWLAEYVDLVPGTTPEDVHAALVRVGLEEEDVHTFELNGPIVVGEVLEFVEEPQSNGKTIRWCQVRVAPDGETAADGGDAVHGIVCGARNFFVGDKVVVTLPGRRAARPVPDRRAQDLRARVRRHDRVGARARPRRRPRRHPAPVDARHRRARRHRRDRAARPRRRRRRDQRHARPRLRVLDPRRRPRVRARDRCARSATRSSRRAPWMPRATASPSRSATRRPSAAASARRCSPRASCAASTPTRPTPAWMIARLKLAGIRSISLLVDITNYVMLELGQPIHGYDLDRLQRRHRRAPRDAGREARHARRQGAHARRPKTCVVTDDRGPIGLAGVMGGAEHRDRRFDARTCSSRRRTGTRSRSPARPVGTSCRARPRSATSAASTREIAAAAAARVAQLWSTSRAAPPTPAGSLIHEAPARAAIMLPDGYVSRPHRRRVHRTTRCTTRSPRSAATVTRVDGGFEVVTPPSWRPDLTGRAELAEEVARIVGYHRIPSVLPVAPPGRGLTRAQRIRRRVADTLAAAGSTEVLSFPFAHRGTRTTGSERRRRRPWHPCASRTRSTPSAALMRRSLLPGLIEAASATCRAASSTCRSSSSAPCSSPSAGRAVRHADCPSATRGRATTTSRAAGRHPAAAAPRRRAVRRRRRRRSSPARRAVAAGIVDALDVVRAGRAGRRRRDRDRAGLAPGAAPRAAPPSCAWPAAPSGSRASCCPRSRRRPTCRAWSRWSSSTSTR